MSDFINYEGVINKIRYLNLEGFESNFDSMLQKTKNNEIDFIGALDFLLSCQINVKKDNVYKTAIKVSKFPFIKTFDDFDFNFQLSLNKAQILSFGTLEFLEKNENIIFSVHQVPEKLI